MTYIALLALGLLAAILIAALAATMRRGARQATAALEAGRRLAAIFDHAAVGIAYLDCEGRWLRLNDRFCEIGGYARDQLMGLTVDDITHPDDLAGDRADRENLRSGRINHSSAEKRYLRKDGTVTWVNVTRSSVRDDAGHPDFIVVVAEEINARKQAETQLTTGEAQYRAIFDSAVEAMAVIDAEGAIQSVNPSVARIFGYAPAELIGKNIKLLMPDSIGSRHDAYLDRYRDTGERAIIGIGREVIGQRKDGTVFPLDLSVAEWERDGTTFFTGVMRDVSARKDAEDALIAQEAQYRAIFDSAVEAMAVIDAEGAIQSVNPSVARIFGYSPTELIDKNIKLLMPDAIGSQHDAYLDHYRDTGKRAIIGIGREVIGQRKDGTVFPLDLSVAEWERDGTTFFTGVMRDVSARKGAEDALIAQEAQYRAIFDSAVEAMAVIDAEGTIQSVNPSVARIFGYAPAELIGKNIKMLMPDSIGSRHDAYLGRYRDTGERAIIGIGREVIGQRKDGTVFPLDLSVAEWERDGTTFFTGVMRDVSARRDAETALRASEDKLRLLQNEFAHLARVNDLGEMAAAIAHEINQPLTAISNYLNAGLAEPGDVVSDADAEIQEILTLASAQALRAGEIVRRLRQFVGHGNGTRTVERAQQLTDSAMALALIDARSSGISVERIAGADDAEVEVDAVQIQQVLVNLLRNAVDALGSDRPDEHRRLTVTTRRGPRKSVEFVVADNGPGISADLSGRLFDPFVTTKEKGMGMGLSVCRRLIEAHGGTIEVESRPGDGATFLFHLPQLDQSGARSS